MEPFRDRTAKAEAIELLRVLTRRAGFLADPQALKAAETTARLLLAQKLDEEERRAAQSLWTNFAEARRYPRQGKRAEALTRHLVMTRLDDLCP